MKPSFKCVLISFLWVIWFLLLPCTFAAIIVTRDGSWTKFWWMSSAVLALVAWINWGLHRKDRFNIFAAMIATGMTCGMLADIYSAFHVFRFIKPLTMSILLFALGHVAYIWGMLNAASRLEITQRSRWRAVLVITIIIYCILGAGIWVIVVNPSDKLPTMHLPTAAYTIFLSLAAAVMATVAIFDRRFLAMGIGGFLFLASDGFLAIRLFQNNWHGLGDLCWITYGIGEMLIVYGAIGAVWKREKIDNKIEHDLS